jgi:hypothetical protein
MRLAARFARSGPIRGKCKKSSFGRIWYKKREKREADEKKEIK